MRLLTTFAALGGVTTLVLATVAQAQMYRSVGPDGRVTYSDKPPAAAEAAPSVNRQRSGRGEGEPGSATAGGEVRGGPAAAGLSYALRQVVQRYPVILYAAPDCAPCQSGRNLLLNRGVPFAEKTVTTHEDTEALRRLTGGQASLPVLNIGKQQLHGYSDADWSQYLDAAGYPSSSQLPSGYQRPAATPLVSVQPADAQREPTPTSSAVSNSAAELAQPESSSSLTPVSPATPARSADNPAGIRF